MSASAPIGLTPGRCSSCGVFVSKTKPPACWRVIPATNYRQVANSEWNYFARTRCHNCGPDGRIWIPVDLHEVEARAALISLALDRGIDERDWSGMEDVPVVLDVTAHGDLAPTGQMIGGES